MLNNLLRTPIKQDLIALLAGCLLPFAFAPYNLFPLAVIAPAILLSSLFESSSGRSAWRGFLFGLSAFGIGVYWVFISIHTFGDTPAILAGILTALFIFALSAFTATQTFLFSKLSPHLSWPALCITFPASWVLLEWMRSWVLTGFPWLLLGASQTYSPLKGFAPLVGELGISFLVALSGGLIVLAIRNWRQRGYIYLLALIFIWIVGYATSFIHWTKPQGKAIQISLIQGNIPQEIKWNPDAVVPTLRTYYQLTQKHWDSRLIIWPEAAIPLLQKQAQPFLDKLDKEAKQHNAALIVGIPVQQGFDYYNAMLLLGVGEGKYYKRHLVPFGEYVPLENWLRGLLGFFNVPMSDFSAGPAKQADLKIDDLVLAPFICYEIAYSEPTRLSARKANFLITISNDAWFGESHAANQHLQLGQIRALETGRYAIFTTNNGITAIVNPQGEIVQQLPRFQQGVLTATAQPMQGFTPFLHFGNYPIVGLMIILLGVGFYFGRR